MKQRLFVSLAIFGNVAMAFAQIPYRESFTLEDVLALPVTSPPVVSPPGVHVAWVVEENGRRNVWFATPPGPARQLTQYDADDGMLIGGLSFNNDGRYLMFTRGGRVNHRGETYNPRSLPDPVENALWRVAVDDGEVELVEAGGTGSPVFGPDGRLYFSRGTEVWVRPFPEGKSERLLTIRGSASDLTPSPDGTKLAFVSNRGGYDRGTYSFVGVFDLASRSVTYVSPNVEVDRDPVWSPDGTRLAFLRIPVEPKSYRFTDYSDVVPWSIVVGDPVSGDGEVIWTADGGAGSYFLGVRGGSLRWVGEHLVFPWEKTGWKHLYAISSRGGEPRALTTGDFEVSSVAVDEDGETVVFSSNRGDIERQHLFRADLATSGEPEALTSGTGIEQSPVLLANGDVAYLAERADEPSRIERLTRNGEVHVVSRAETGASTFAQFRQPEIVSFAAPDGLRIYAHLYRPLGRLVEGSHPAFVYAHGGCHSKSDPVFRSHIREGLFQYLVSRGYFVLVVNFRSGTGRGLAFREPPAYGGRGAEDVQDFVGAASYLTTIPEVDTRAVALGGWSCGGHIVANLLARHSALYAAGVSYAGVGDWRVEMEMDSGDVMPFRISRRLMLEDLAYESSGVAHLDTWTSPILMIHGDNDLQAAMWPTIETALLLRKKGVPAQTLIFPGEDHGFFLHDNRVRMLHRVWDFLEKYLQPNRVASNRSE
jgi:dipeptidyl aminopeptidase/acylaminoacyl peptidase